VRPSSGVEGTPERPSNRCNFKTEFGLGPLDSSLECFKYCEKFKNI
jgi:hypothetical protein